MHFKILTPLIPFTQTRIFWHTSVKQGVRKLVSTKRHL